MLTILIVILGWNQIVYIEKCKTQSKSQIKKKSEKFLLHSIM